MMRYVPLFFPPGKLAERLSGLAPDPPIDTQWLYMQERAYSREIDVQRSRLSRTVESIAEQQAQGQEFPEIDQADLETKKKSLEDLEEGLEIKQRELDAANAHRVTAERKLAELQQSCRIAQEKTNELKAWLERNRKGRKLDRAQERSARAQEFLQSTIDALIPLMVLLKSQYQAYELETRDFLTLIGHIESACGAEHRLHVQELRSEVSRTVYSIVAEAETVISLLPQKSSQDTKEFDRWLEDHLPEKLLDRIDREKLDLEKQKLEIDQQMAIEETKVKVHKKSHMEFLADMKKVCLRGVNGMDLTVLVDNVPDKKKVVAGPENALWFALDRRAICWFGGVGVGVLRSGIGFAEKWGLFPYAPLQIAFLKGNDLGPAIRDFFARSCGWGNGEMFGSTVGLCCEAVTGFSSLSDIVVDQKSPREQRSRHAYDNFPPEKIAQTPTISTASSSVAISSRMVSNSSDDNCRGGGFAKSTGPVPVLEKKIE